MPDVKGPGDAAVVGPKCRGQGESGGERAEKRARARAEVRGRDKSKDWR